MAVSSKFNLEPVVPIGLIRAPTTIIVYDNTPQAQPYQKVEKTQVVSNDDISFFLRIFNKHFEKVVN